MTQVRLDETVCWQCGAPADPSCVYVEKLEIRGNRHADSEGYPAKRGRWTDHVRVPIPRCSKCQARNYIIAGMIMVGFAIGAWIGSYFGSKGWGMPVGAFAIGIPLAYATQAIQRRLGYRLTKDYPPIQKLRAAGWTDPG